MGRRSRSHDIEKEGQESLHRSGGAGVTTQERRGRSHYTGEILAEVTTRTSNFWAFNSSRLPQNYRLDLSAWSIIVFIGNK